MKEEADWVIPVSFFPQEAVYSKLQDSAIRSPTCIKSRSRTLKRNITAEMPPVKEEEEVDWSTVKEKVKNSPYVSAACEARQNVCPLHKQVTHMLVHGEFLTFSFTGAILLCVICRASSIPPHSQSRCHLA